MRGPEQRNLYSKRRYEPGFMSLAAYNTLQHEIRRHVTGVPKFQAYAPERVAFKLLLLPPPVRLFIGEEVPQLRRARY